MIENLGIYRTFVLLDLTRRLRWGGGSLRAFRLARVETVHISGSHFIGFLGVVPGYGRINPDRADVSQKGPQRSPRVPPEHPEALKRRPRGPPRAPRIPPKPPKGAQEIPKRIPREPQYVLNTICGSIPWNFLNHRNVSAIIKVVDVRRVMFGVRNRPDGVPREDNKRFRSM